MLPHSGLNGEFLDILRQSEAKTHYTVLKQLEFNFSGFVVDENATTYTVTASERSPCSTCGEICLICDIAVCKW